MGDYKPLYLSLAILFIIGVLIPSIISPFADLEELKEDFEGNIITNGISIFGFNINPFNIIPRNLRDSLEEYSLYFGLIPNVIKIPALILFWLGIIYTFIKLLPTT